MQFTYEQINKAKTAKTAGELLAMAKAENHPMTAEEAEIFFEALNKNGELTDDELTAIAGGKGDEPDPMYEINQRVWVKYADMGWGDVTDRYYASDGWHYIVHVEIVSFGGKLHIYDMTFREDQLSPHFVR